MSLIIHNLGNPKHNLNHALLEQYDRPKVTYLSPRETNNIDTKASLKSSDFYVKEERVRAYNKQR